MIIPRLVVIFALLVMTAVSFAQDRIKFPAAVGTKTIGQNMLWVGSKQGFFEEQGLEVQPILLRGSSITVQALVGESIYAASSSADVTIGAIRGYRLYSWNRFCRKRLDGITSRRACAVARGHRT